MKRDKMIQMIGDRLIDEIKQIAKDKQVDIKVLIEQFDSVIDLKIVNPDVSADEVAQAHEQELNVENLKQDVLQYIHRILEEEYTIPAFLN